MDADFMSGLFLSMLMFAPGVVLLVTCGLIGIALLLEKAGLLGCSDVEVVREKSQAGNPTPETNGVVERLRLSIKEDIEEELDRTGT